MKVEITRYEKKFSFEMEQITQLCGQNIPEKSYILDSLRKYFGTYRYSEEKNPWRNNVFIDGETVGRKYFSVISVASKNDLISMIKLSKQSLMTEYLKHIIQDFDHQKHLEIIDEELEKMFLDINKRIGQIGKLFLTYSSSDIWDMVQSSEIRGENEESMDGKSTSELMVIFINLLEKVMDIAPKKQMIIIENADHFLTEEEYQEFVKKIRIMCRKYDLYFILSVSLDHYVVIDKELSSGIVVYNDMDFQMPELENILEAVNDGYPYNKNIKEEEIICILESIVQKIGKKKYLCSIEENVVCKIINQSMMLYDKRDCSGFSSELSFLKD